MKRFGSVGCSIFVLISSIAEPAHSVDNPVDFNRDIRPILSDTCFKCHGPDKAERQADLRLDVEQGIVDATQLISPGDVDNSDFLDRIFSDDDSEIMPPVDSGRRLTQQQKSLLQEWVEQGAVFEKHWSFKPFEKPQPPRLEDDRVANPIDKFVLRRLANAELKPNELADRNTLIRRVCLDLTGLPPESAMVERFSTSRASDWYIELVDELLASPHFGEHMARYWLDAARYADTHGLHLDNYREMWLYRDWVVGAFNDNLPFDQFIIEQLAGDLLADPSDSQLIATGFNRAHVTTNEGGSIDEEIIVRNVVDRVSTTGTVFLGLTVGCAQCHDHKYDPISQQDFYSLYAFFNSLDAKPMDGNNKEHAPSLRYFDEQQKQQFAALEKKRKQLSHQIEQKLAAYEYVDSHKQASSRVDATASDVVWIDDSLPVGAKKTGEWKLAKTGTIEPFSGKQVYVDQNKEFSQIYVLNAKQRLRFGADDKFFVNLFLDPENPPREIMLQFHAANWNHRAYWGENLISFGTDGTSSRHRMGDLPETGRWLRLEVDVEQVGFESTSEIHGLAFSQHGGKVYWDSAGVVTSMPQKFIGNSLSCWLSYQRDIGGIDLPDQLRKRFVKFLSKTKNETGAADASGKDATDRDASESDSEQVTAAQRKFDQLLKAYFLRHVNEKTVALIGGDTKELTEVERELDQMKMAAPTTLVWKEKAKPVAAFVLRRGEYDQQGEPVVRDTPAFLPALSNNYSRDRLGLAKWLVDRSNPLTARVAVNRIWQQMFGIGIVASSDDFGAQGEPPSHPMLLDWLAVEFMESGWDTKRLIKTIVSSSTYRQSSKTSPLKLKRDPENRLLSHGARYRLDAEALRDQALAVSGLLVRTVGGPGVKPPQPDGLWYAVGYTTSNTVRFKQDSGHDKVHRRSLYTFWKRTSPPPQMSTFDAPTRESCIVRRERTNTPLQALLLMNDPQYVEAARYLAQLSLDQKFETIDQDICFVYERVMGKPIAENVLELLRRNFERDKFEFRRNMNRANELIKIGESTADEKYEPARLAAMTMLASLLMNQDEFVSKN